MEKILKTSIKNLFAIVLSTVVALSVMVTNAFAATEPSVPASVTLTNLEQGATVTVYKIADVNWDLTQTKPQPKEPIYVWNTSVAQYVKDKHATYIDAKNNVTKEYFAAGAADTKAFLEGLVNVSGLTADKSVTVTPTGAVTKNAAGVNVQDVALTNLKGGQYLIVAKSNTFVYRPTTVTVAPHYDAAANEWVYITKATNITTDKVGMKGEPVNKPEKEITDKTNGHYIGETIPFKVSNLTIPTYASSEKDVKYVLSDTMSTGLTFNQDSLVVKVDGQPVVASADTYDVVKTASGFTITFKEAYIRANAGKAVVLEYSATLNEASFDQTTVKNTIKVEFNNKGSVETGSRTDEELVYTYGLQLTKKYKDSTGNPLAGATFTLAKADGTVLKFIDKGNGLYVLAQDQTNVNATEKLVTAADGTLKVVGLELGTYTLTEIVAPNGHVLLKDTIKVTLSEKNPMDGTLDTVNVECADATKVSTGTIAKNQLQFEVYNLTENDLELPNTGGMGTVIFTVGGIVLMVGSAFFLFASRKRNEE